MPTIAEQRARIAELASRMIAKNPGNAGAIMQQLKSAGLDISGNPIGGQGGGAFALPRVPPAGGLSYTGLMTPEDLGPLAKYAGRTPAAPPTGLSPDEMALPFSGTGGDPNSLRSMADRGDPSQAPGFRSRLNAAMGTAGVELPGPKLSTQAVRPDLSGYLHGDTSQLGFPAAPPSFAGNLPRTRPPEQLAAAGPPSPLAQAGGPSPLPGVGPSAPIIGREARPGLNGPPSPLASRFGDQSQLPGGAFSGSLPRPPQPRPFESQIAARPMPPGGPGSLPAAPLLAGKPFPSAPGMASRFGDQSQLASGAFTGGPPPPMASGPAPPTPQQLDAAKDMVRQMASLPSVPPSSPLTPLETTPTSTMPNPLQRAPLDLAAGVGAPRLPLGSTNLPFATDTPASVDQRTAAILGPRPPGVGTGLPGRTAQAPLISVPPAAGTAPVGPVTSQDLSPPVGVPPSLAAVRPPNPARMEVVANYNQPPPGMGDRPFPGAPPTPPPAPAAPAQQTPYGRGAGRLAGTLLGVGAGLASGSLPAAIVEGGLGYKLGGYAGRKIGQAINPNAPPALDASGVPAITPPPPPPPQTAAGGIFGQGMRGIGRQMQRAIAAVAGGKLSPEAASKAFGVPKESLRDSLGSMGSAGRGGMGMGGMGGGGYGYSGSGGSGGQYGGGGGYNIRDSIGGAYRNR